MESEEIKEILKDIDLVANYNKVPIYYTQKHIKTLLDYITNLQQEKEYLEHIINNLKDNNNRLEEIIHDTDIVLEQENERLKEKLENKLTPEELVNMLNQELVKQNKCYKSRCEKANEYMKDFIFEGLLVQEDRKLIMYNENLRKFENILNGSAENE